MERLRAAIQWWGNWPHRARVEALLVALLILLPLSTPIESLMKIWRYGARGPATNGLMIADFSTLTFTLLLGVYALCARRLRAVPVAALWMLAWLLKEEVFSQTLHRVFVDWSIYPGLLIREGKTEPNPGTAKLLCLFVVGVLLLAAVCLRRTRTFDRIFVMVMIGSVYMTFWLFHWITVAGLATAREQGEVTLRLVVEAPDTHFQSMCEAAGGRCFTGRLDEPPVVTGIPAADWLLSWQLQRVSGNLEGQTSFAHSHASARRSVNTALHHMSDGRYRFAVDQVRYREAMHLYEGVYGVLANSAHLLWLGGGFYLLAWHRRKIWARVKNPARTLS